MHKRDQHLPQSQHKTHSDIFASIVGGGAQRTKIIERQEMPDRKAEKLSDPTNPKGISIEKEKKVKEMPNLQEHAHSIINPSQYEKAPKNKHMDMTTMIGTHQWGGSSVPAEKAVRRILS